MKSKKPLQKKKKGHVCKPTPKPAPLTEHEIPLINETVSLPEDTPSKELLAFMQLLSAMAPSLLQQMLEYLSAQSCYYTKDSFLKTFGICVNTCKKWMAKGLPYIQLDSILLFRKSDVDEFFNRFRKIAPALIPFVSALFQSDEAVQVLTQL